MARHVLAVWRSDGEPVSFDASAAAWAYVRHHPGELDAHETLVLLCLADHQNAQTRQLNPSLRTMAKECGCGVRTVQRALDRLQSMGVLLRTSGGGSVTSRYILMMDPSQRDHGTRVTRTRGMATQTTPPGQTDTPPWSERPTNQEETKKEPGADAAATPNGAGAALRMVVSKPADHEASKAAANRVMAELAARWSKSV